MIIIQSSALFYFIHVTFLQVNYNASLNKGAWYFLNAISTIIRPSAKGFYLYATESYRYSALPIFDYSSSLFVSYNWSPFTFLFFLHMQQETKTKSKKKRDLLKKNEWTKDSHEIQFSDRVLTNNSMHLHVLHQFLHIHSLLKCFYIKHHAATLFQVSSLINPVSARAFCVKQRYILFARYLNESTCRHNYFVKCLGPVESPRYFLNFASWKFW